MRGVSTVIPRSIIATPYGTQRQLERFEARLASEGTGLGASLVGYDNTTSGLSATDLQTALDAMATTTILPAPTQLTIAGGVVTATQSTHTLETQGGAGTDDLDTITAAQAGFYIFSLVNAAHNVVFKHGTGNIVCPFGQDITLDVLNEKVLTYSNGTNVFVLSENIQTWANSAIGAYLSSTATGEGASLVGVEDANNLYAGATVEALLTEIRTIVGTRAAQALTISAGAEIIITQSVASVETDGGAATDDLDTITAATPGFYAIYPVDGTHTVVVKHQTGNIFCPMGQDITLSNISDYVLFYSNGTNVYVIGTRLTAIDHVIEEISAGGAITAHNANIWVETNGGGAADDLDTINGTVDGGIYVISAAAVGHTVTIRSGAGNIYTNTGTNIILAAATDYVVATAVGATVMIVGECIAAWAGSSIGGILSSTATGEGASLVGTEDAGLYFSTNTVEGNLQELGAFCLDLFPSRRYNFWDDFIGKQLDLVNGPWSQFKGADGGTAHFAILPAGIRGIIQGSTGANAGTPTVAQNGVELVGAGAAIAAADGGLIIEWLVRASNVASAIIQVGLTDNAASLEAAFAINATDVVSANAADAACFVYDTTAATDQWFACAVDTNVVDAGSGATGVVPVNNTYQRLALAVSADGTTITYGINGAIVKTLTGSTGVAPSVPLYPYIMASAPTGATFNVQAEYVVMRYNRA